MLLRKGILITGVGGQGVLLAATILGRAMVIHGKGFATLTRSYGPEARGTRCEARLILSSKPVASPFLSQWDYEIHLEPPPFQIRPIGQGTQFIIGDGFSTQVDSGFESYQIPARKIATTLGFPQAINLIVLGSFIGITRLVNPEYVRAAISDWVPMATLEKNLSAFDEGLRFATRLS